MTLLKKPGSREKASRVIGAPGRAPSVAPVRAFQWDLARQVERMDWLVGQLPRLADWGYQELYLHLEDAVEYPSLPGVARGDAYSHRALGRLVRAATRAGLGVVPIVNLLGHTQYLIKVPELQDLNECRAPDGSPLPRGQICPLHPRMPEIVERLLRDVRDFCTAGKVHVGLDESYHLGRHPLSRAEIAESGLAAHFGRYVQRLDTQAAGFGLRLGIWADMLALLPEAIRLLPAGMAAYDWYYHPFPRLPRIEARNFAEYDLVPALLSHGIDYWGCPMAGSFRHEPMPVVSERLRNCVDWWRRCARAGAPGFLVTSWEPQRLAAELPMAVAAAAAGLWIEGEQDPRRLWELGCARAFGKRGRAAAARTWASDEAAFCGYRRWAMNERWDTALGDGPIGPWRREERWCSKLADPAVRISNPPSGEHAAKGARGRRSADPRVGGASVRGSASGPDVGPREALPVAVLASLRYRAYLARRDLFVRKAGVGQLLLRRAAARGDRRRFKRLLAGLADGATAFSQALPPARSAARAMWRRTRYARSIGPNEHTVLQDRQRLRAWRAWLRKCRANAETSWESSPMAGAWQLTFTVTEDAPALQRVVVEQRSPDGAWTELFGLFLIEFRAYAASPRAKLAFGISAPISWDGPPAEPPQIRICARGLGRFEVKEVTLTDGLVTFSAGKRRMIVTLGSTAAKSGFPDFDWAKDRGVWELDWNEICWDSRGPHHAPGNNSSTPDVWLSLTPCSPLPI